ncbi:RDD family protein [Bacillus sp. JJ1764]|uniref:RDD family protein n=1 Tax=Bacillus sp. JJ1764 TaxID=3122964 RepID=UPI002FFDFF9E
MPFHNGVDAKLPIHYAGFWMRFWAYLLDLVVVGSIERIVMNPIFRGLGLSLSEHSLFAPVTIVSAVIFYLYFVLMTKFFRQTLGKMVFGLKVIGVNQDTLSWGTIIFREWIGRFISATIILGYLIVAFLPKKQGLHDLFTDTTVVHTER